MRFDATESGAPHPRVLVIGYGSPIRGDDAAGRIVAERLAVSAAAADDERLAVIVTHQLVPELADPISRADLVLFVDAAAHVRPGKFSARPVGDAGGCADGRPMAHRCGPREVLALSEQAYGRRPEAWTIAVGAGSFEVGESLSPAVQRVIPRVQRFIDVLIASRVASECVHA